MDKLVGEENIQWVRVGGAWYPSLFETDTPQPAFLSAGDTLVKGTFSS